MKNVASHKLCKLALRAIFAYLDGGLDAGQELSEKSLSIGMLLLLRQHEPDQGDAVRVERVLVSHPDPQCRFN
jgi:hypothetical protein